MSTLLEVLEKSKAFVVYLCAGIDWQAITFTTAQFLKYRTGIEFKTPDTYIFVDKLYNKNYKEKLENKILFEDEFIKIQKQNLENIDSPFEYIKMCRAELIIKKQPSWATEEIPNRIFNIIFIDTDWRDFVSFLHQHKFKPYIGIGITDGCAFGGNDECVNGLNFFRKLGKPSMQVHKDMDSNYWITDHFSNCQIPNPLRNGDYILSRDESFPVRYKKLALLSSRWGNYGKWTDGAEGAPFRGATIFSKEKLD